jgi:uncharacterized membrane protein
MATEAQTQQSLPTAAEIINQRAPLRNINEEHAASLTALEKVALWITEHVGSMGFFILIAAWTVVWLGWNLLAQALGWHEAIFDQPWSFLIWLFISNLIQIHLMPLIMVGQNLQSRHAELRAEHAYQVTEQDEYEAEMTLRYLQAISESLQRLEERVGKLEGTA